MVNIHVDTTTEGRASARSSDLRMMGWALSYAVRGFNVFPIRSKAKTPLTAHGLKDATIDPETIRAWWIRWPNANIGIRTGPESDLAVLDVDGPQGEASLRDLDPLPDTWVALTGRGAHFWFRFPDLDLRNSAGKIGAGLDVRATGGYVIAPPSIHPNGAVYVWPEEHRRRQPWPTWLLPTETTVSIETTAPIVQATRRTDAYARTALDRELLKFLRTPTGQRNEQLNRSVHAIARLDEIPDDVIVGAFTAAALRIGLEPEETDATITSALEARRS